MSSEPDDGNWWWHGKVALSPTTFFISVWAPAVSRLNRTEEREERGREMSDGYRGSIQTWDKRQMLRIGRKQNRADRGNWDGKTQREIWPRIPITIWQMLRYVSPGHCRETEWGFLLIREIDFVMRGQGEVLWWSLSITPFDKGKNTLLFTETAAGGAVAWEGKVHSFWYCLNTDPSAEEKTEEIRYGYGVTGINHIFQMILTKWKTDFNSIRNYCECNLQS